MNEKKKRCAQAIYPGMPNIDSLPIPHRPRQQTFKALTSTSLAFRTPATGRKPGFDKSKRTNKVVYHSTVASLVVQVLVGGVTAAGFFIKPPAEQQDDLRVILGLELSSQVVELVWYLAVITYFKQLRTWSRYIDWVLSTPVMLLSTAFFFLMRRNIPLVDIFSTGTIYCCLVFNWLMLACGFALETKVLPLWPLLMTGALCLVGSFTFLARFVDGTDSVSTSLFFTIYFVWFLYGFAAFLPYTWKNVSYNILDIISKNCYGLFLFVYVLRYEDWFAM